MRRIDISYNKTFFTEDFAQKRTTYLKLTKCIVSLAFIDNAHNPQSMAVPLYRVELRMVPQLRHILCIFGRRKQLRMSTAPSSSDAISPSHQRESQAELGRRQMILDQNLAKLKHEARNTREVQANFITDVSTAFSWLTSGTYLLSAYSVFL